MLWGKELSIVCCGGRSSVSYVVGEGAQYRMLWGKELSTVCCGGRIYGLHNVHSRDVVRLDSHDNCHLHHQNTANLR